MREFPSQIEFAGHTWHLMPRDYDNDAGYTLDSACVATERTAPDACVWITYDYSFRAHLLAFGNLVVSGPKYCKSVPDSLCGLARAFLERERRLQLLDSIRLGAIRQATEPRADDAGCEE